MSFLIIRIGGNQFRIGVNYPPWKFPTDVMPNEQNISSPPTTESSAIEKYPSHESGDNRKKRPGSGGIVIMVVGAVMTVIGAAVFVAVRTHRSTKQTLDSIGGSLSSLQSLPISASQGQRKFFRNTSIYHFPQLVCVKAFAKMVSS